MNTPKPAGKFRVEDAFKDQDSFHPIFPGQDPNKILQSFDHPEELQVMQDHPNYLPYLIRKRDSDRWKRRKEVTLEVFVEAGIDPWDQGQVQGLSGERRMELQNKIEEKLKQ